MKDPKISVKEALTYFGGVQAKLASAFNLSRMAVTYWRRNGRNLPPVWAYRMMWHYPVKGRPPIKDIVKEWDEKNAKSQ